MEEQVESLVKKAIQPLVVRIEQLEADNRELKARVDNIQAEELKRKDPKGPLVKEAPGAKPIPGKDSKKPETAKGENGRPSAPVAIKEFPKPERPITGKPADKKPVQPIPKPGVKKDDEHKDMKTVTSPKAVKDIKKDVKSPVHEPKPADVKNIKSPVKAPVVVAGGKGRLVKGPHQQKPPVEQKPKEEAKTEQKTEQKKPSLVPDPVEDPLHDEKPIIHTQAEEEMQLLLDGPAEAATAVPTTAENGKHAENPGENAQTKVEQKVVNDNSNAQIQEVIADAADII